jgi:hypothetical protein
MSKIKEKEISIKVIDTTIQPTTDNEKRSMYNLWKQNQTQFIDEHGWDLFLDMEINNKPSLIFKSDIFNVQIFKLLDSGLVILVFDGNPHFSKTPKSNQSLLITIDKPINVIDNSFREYSLSSGETVVPKSIQLIFQRQSNGIGYTFPKQPNQNKIILPTGLSVFVDQINTMIKWEYNNQSLASFLSDFNNVNKSNKTQENKKDENKKEVKKSVFDLFYNIGWDDTKVFKSADLDKSDIDIHPGLLAEYHKFQMLGKKFDTNLSYFKKYYDSIKDMQRHNFESQFLLFVKNYKNLLAEEMFDVKSYDFLNEKNKKTVNQIVKKRDINSLIVSKNQTNEKSIQQTIQDAIMASTTSLDPINKLIKYLNTKLLDRPLNNTNNNNKNWYNAGNTKLCPHYASLLLEISKNSKPNQLGQYDIQSCIEKVTFEWADKDTMDSGVNYKYYCKHCGELLMSDDLGDFNIFGEQAVANLKGQQTDPIYETLLAEITQASRYLTFKSTSVQFNMRKIITGLIDMMEPTIQPKISILQKSKTRSVEDIDALIGIHICAYALAFFAKLIIDNSSKLTFTTLLQSQNAKIAQDAKSAQGGRNQIGTQKINPAQILSAAYMILIIIKQNKISKMKDFTIENLKPILIEGFEWAKVARFESTSIEDSESKQMISLEMASQIANDPWYNMILMYLKDKKLSQKYINLVCENPPDLFKDFSSVNQTQKDKNARGELLEYLKIFYGENTMPMSPVLKTYYDQWKPFIDESIKQYKSQYIQKAKPMVQIYDHYKGQVPEFESLDISKVQCPSGDKHDYSLKRVTYVYLLSGNKKKEYKFSDLRDVPDGAKLIDQLCANCGMGLLAPPNKSSHKEIHHNIEKKNFYNYFEHRCPYDQLNVHEYDSNGTCKNCSYSLDKVGDETYFKKWYSKYPKFVLKSVPIISVNDNIKKEKFTWKPNNVSLAQLAKITSANNISYNMWLNLGLTEGMPFVEIKDGKLNPQADIKDENDPKYVARNTKIINYIKFVRITYYMVKNNSKIVVSSPELKAIIEKAPAALNMPDILVHFDKQLSSLNGSLANKCNFLLHTLSETLLKSIREQTVGMGKMAHPLFDYLVAEILRSEKLVSKLDIKKMKIIQATQQLTEEALIDDETYMEMGDKQDILDKGTEDPFSLDDVDIATANTGDEEDYQQS